MLSFILPRALGPTASRPGPGTRGVLLALVVASAYPATAPRAATAYTIQRGDTLSEIALRFYGNAQRWQDIFLANRDVLDHPHRIRAGARITMPGIDEAELSNDEQTSLRLVTGDDYQPFAGRDLQEDGLATVLLHRILKKTKYTADISFLPWAEGARKTKRRDFDLTYPYLKTASRREDFLFSNKITDLYVRIFVRAGSGIRYQRAADLKGLRFCKAKGYYEDDVRPLQKRGLIEVVYKDSITGCFKALQNRKVDAVPVNRFTGWSQLRSIGANEQNYCMLERPIKEGALHLMMSKQHPRARAILNDINEAIGFMRDKGALATIRQSYVETYQANHGFARRLRAEACERTRETKTTANLNLVTGPAYPPFADEGLPKGGMAVEIVKEAFRRQDKEIEIGWQDWGKGYRRTKELEHDGTFPYVKTRDRQKKFVYSDPIYDMKSRIFVRNGSDLTYSGGMMDLRGRRACKPKAYYKSDLRLEIANDVISLAEADGIDACFRKLAEGDVDFVTANRFTGWAAIERLSGARKKAFKILPTPKARVGLHLIVPKAHPKSDELIQTFNEGLAEMRKTGALQVLQEKHIERYQIENGFARRSVEDVVNF